MTQIQTRIVGPVPAECPEDGGRWALLCEHLIDGEWQNAGIIQDTNKKRLAGWKTEKWDDGLTGWCPDCQLAHWGEYPR